MLLLPWAEEVWTRHCAVTRIQITGIDRIDTPYFDYRRSKVRVMMASALLPPQCSLFYMLGA